MNSNVREAIDAFRRGLPVIVCDDADRENEADIVLPAQLATAYWIGWTIAHSSGLLCAPMTAAIANRLELPAMVIDNRDPKGTAYTVTVDARVGVGTGIGAADRTRTLNLLASPDARPGDLTRPGHVLPLRGHEAGLAGRRGHTEAAIALCEMAELTQVGVIAEAVDRHGEPLSRSGAHHLCVDYSLPMVDIAELADAYHGWATFRSGRPDLQTSASTRVNRRDTATMPTRYGDFKAVGYFDCATGDEHVAMIAGSLSGEEALVRIHSQCMTSESLFSRRCDCAEQLEMSIAMVSQRGGVVIYLTGHEGRGIGLTAKLAAYRLQDEHGLDTVDANLAINAPVDSREYGAAVAILQDLGVQRVRLLTGNPAKVAALRDGGIRVAQTEPLAVGQTPANRSYLHTKRSRLGHVC
jgi:3,4-dihydroxy 2-butanone 4-phosphate synthase/GTP cyclohydrolase II